MSKFILLALAVFPLTIHAASRTQDYETVRKIALRDPKVRAAYAEAERRLEQRIVEIDPTLKDYKPGQPAPKKAAAPKPTPKPTPKPAPVRGTKHKVAKGETLESIATEYRVGVPTLKQANPGVHERRLQVGQVLIIPKKNTTAAAANSRPAKKEKSWWEQLAE